MGSPVLCPCRPRGEDILLRSSTPTPPDPREDAPIPFPLVVPSALSRGLCLYLRAPVTRTVYCLNEAEMVDVALGILIEGRKQEEPTLAATDNLQFSPPYSASPHTSSPGSSGEEEGGGSSSPALGLSPSRGPEATDSPCSRSPEGEEEDALKYVREIFFS